MKKPGGLFKTCAYILGVFVVLGVAFYAIAHEQLCYKTAVTEPVSVSSNTGELLAGDVIEQPFTADGDTVRGIAVFFQTYSRTAQGSLRIAVLEGDSLLFETSVEAAALGDNAFAGIPMELTGVDGKTLTLRICSDDAVTGSAVTVALGDSMSAGKFDVALDGLQPAVKNGEPLTAAVCMKVTTIQNLRFGQYYWLFFSAATLLVTLWLLYLLGCEKRGKRSIWLGFFSAFSRYGFLLRQLVSRDFKTRYKRSVLGVFWSFLNPLLTMLVQYVVFSTLFRSDVPNYLVYLLSGIVCFSYFNEAANQCMMSITGNASLITKVYIPKYIFPISKLLSSGINLLLSLIPLLVVALVTGLPVRASILLLPFGLACLFLFCCGMGMLLATLMVFFRDTQFLWGVISMLWMYCTPIFYPVSIIPERFLPLFKMNPLFHVIRFIRTVLIDGVSPEPKAYLYCLIACGVPLLIGLWVFKKNQHKFVLYV